MEDKQKNSRNTRIALILLIIFVFILILFLILIRKPAIFSSFAEMSSVTEIPSTSSVITPQSVSYDNSYLFASPLKATVGSQRVRLTVYILDGQGMGVSGKSVILANESPNLHIYAVSQTTDDYGMATFDIASDQSGLFTIEASVDGKKISQRVTISFD